jgi:hypothetical protein
VFKMYLYKKLLAPTSSFVSRETKRFLITIRCSCYYFLFKVADAKCEPERGKAMF